MKRQFILNTLSHCERGAERRVRGQRSRRLKRRAASPRNASM